MFILGKAAGIALIIFAISIVVINFICLDINNNQEKLDERGKENRCTAIIIFLVISILSIVFIFGNSYFTNFSLF